jgi:hypothetical protein
MYKTQALVSEPIGMVVAAQSEPLATEQTVIAYWYVMAITGESQSFNPHV